jgi:hypothetical protein
MTGNTGRPSAGALGWSGVRVGAWALGIAVALYQMVVFRQWVNGDAISYFDMSDAIPSHQWSRLVSATWSPLYPALIGLVNSVLHPSAAWEFPVAHLVNFLCFLLAFVSFEFLLRSMLGWGSPAGEPLPRWAVLAIGYSLFLWASLGMLTLMKPTPDMLMSAFLYLSVGLLLRLRTAPHRWKTWVVFGVVLGVGYLAKAIMFPLGGIMLLASLGCAGDLRRRVLRTALAGCSFAVIAGPFMAAVSRVAHRPTFGEAGTVVHLLYLDKIAPYWQSTGDATGAFIHPVKKLVGLDPPAFSFARPISVTTAIWYDPYYWTEGVRPGFQWQRQRLILRRNVWIYLGVLERMAGLGLALVVLWWAAGLRGTTASILAFWPMLLVGAAALGAYATLHVEERYLGAFLAVIWLALLYGVRTPRPLAPRLVGALVAVIVLNLGWDTTSQILGDVKDNASKNQIHDFEASVALHERGIAPGDRVASISPWVASGWARLARVSIIAEVQRTRANEFWNSSEENQRAVLAAFAAAGCTAVISWVGDMALPAGWQRLGDSPYAVHLLS